MFYEHRRKLRVALQLEKLGVDVIIEAGFAAASPGDFDAVSQIAKIVVKKLNNMFIK